MTPEDVGTGVVTGGWSYVAWSYGLAWLALGAYALSLWIRTPEEDE